MTNLNDLFVSYKIINEPEITIPRYDVDLAPATMISQGDLTSKVLNIKNRMRDSLAFLWTSGGSKEPEYSLPKSVETELTSTNSNFLPQTTIRGDKNSWKMLMFLAYKRAGASDLFARNLVGLDALETGWGKKVVGLNNYGNIKATKSWRGNSKKAYDKKEGSYDAYRSYATVDDYVQDKLRLLRSRYGMSGNESPGQFADKLVAGGYATDKQYRNLIIKTINSV